MRPTAVRRGPTTPRRAGQLLADNCQRCHRCVPRRGAQPLPDGEMPSQEAAQVDDQRFGV